MEENKKTEERDASGNRMILLSVFALLAGIFLLDYIANTVGWM